MIIRNDDFPWGITLDEMREFCEVCDKYDAKLIHAVPIFGECYDIDSSWTNDWIISRCTTVVPQEKIEFMRERTKKDLFSVHGLYHTHYPTTMEIRAAKLLLESWGLTVGWYTPPFNEYDNVDTCGLRLSVMSLQSGERLEDYLPGKPLVGKQIPDFAYLHSWRFFRGWYTLADLEKLLRKDE